MNQFETMVGTEEEPDRSYPARTRNVCNPCSQISQDLLLLDLKKKEHIQARKTHEGMNRACPEKQGCSVMSNT